MGFKSALQADVVSYRVWIVRCVRFKYTFLQVTDRSG